MGTVIAFHVNTFHTHLRNLKKRCTLMNISPTEDLIDQHLSSMISRLRSTAKVLPLAWDFGTQPGRSKYANWQISTSDGRELLLQVYLDEISSPLEATRQ